MEIQKTKQAAEKKVILILLSIFIISLVSAVDLGGIPPIPDHFYGNVLIDGNNAPIGTQISVYVGGNLEQTYNVTQAGKYDLYVKTGSSGNLIEFKILDKSAGSSTRQGGQNINLNLSISTTPTSSGDSGGGGGGGGGGSSGSSGGFISPPITINESASGSEENQTQIQEIGDQKTTGIGITGGTILGFVKSGKGIGAVIVIGIIVGVILIKFRAPRKWIKKYS